MVYNVESTINECLQASLRELERTRRRKRLHPRQLRQSRLALAGATRKSGYTFAPIPHRDDCAELPCEDQALEDFDLGDPAGLRG